MHWVICRRSARGVLSITLKEDNLISMTIIHSWCFFAKIASLIFFLSPYCRSFTLLTFVALISWLLLSDITSFAVIWAFLFCLFFWSSLFFLFSILSLLANWLPHTYSKVQKKITLLPIKRLLWTLQNNCIYTIFNKDFERKTNT